MNSVADTGTHIYTCGNQKCRDFQRPQELGYTPKGWRAATGQPLRCICGALLSYTGPKAAAIPHIRRGVIRRSASHTKTFTPGLAVATLCGAPITDRDVVERDARRMAQGDDDLRWNVCAACVAAMNKAGV
jgi:hypothetical protein